MSDVSSTSASESGAGLFSLTQIRHLMRVEFGRAQRYGYPITCLVIEIDRLGYLRDLYGYDMKEALLDDVVNLLQAETRSCDYLGRQVDDRLMAVLPHTGREGGRIAARRLLERAHGVQFSADGRTVRATLSIGCSHFEEGNTMFFDALVDAAEAALAEAINGGGDRVVVRELGTGS